MNDKCALIIFAREPQDGKVKTRLLKDLPVEKVTELYKALIDDVIKITNRVSNCSKYIYFTNDNKCTTFLDQYSQDYVMMEQCGDQLGERMLNAINECNGKGFNRIIIIGTDCITFTNVDIEQAFKEMDDNDCVIGPSEDGGFYLFGVKKTNKAMFNGINWGSHDVLDSTLLNLSKINYKVKQLKTLEDIDDLDDLRRFRELPSNFHTHSKTSFLVKNWTF